MRENAGLVTVHRAGPQPEDTSRPARTQRARGLSHLCWAPQALNQAGGLTSPQSGLPATPWSPGLCPRGAQPGTRGKGGGKEWGRWAPGEAPTTGHSLEDTGPSAMDRTWPLTAHLFIPAFPGSPSPPYSTSQLHRTPGPGLWSLSPLRSCLSRVPLDLPLKGFQFPGS